MNRTSTSLASPRAARTSPSPAAIDAAEEDQYDAGPLTEVVSAALKAPAQPPDRSRTDPSAPLVLYRRTSDGVPWIGVGPSAGMTPFTEQRTRHLHERCWCLLQARNLYMAYPYHHPGNPAVARACAELRALCDRPEVQRGGLPCDTTLLKLLMVLTAADAEKRVTLASPPPDYTRPGTAHFQNPMPTIAEATESPPRVPRLALERVSPPIIALHAPPEAAQTARPRARQRDTLVPASTPKATGQPDRSSTSRRRPAQRLRPASDSPYKGSAEALSDQSTPRMSMIHKSQKPVRLPTLADVMAREAANPEQRTVGPMYHVVEAKHTRMADRAIDFEKHPKALYIRADAEGQAALQIKGRVKTPRLRERSVGDPAHQSEVGRVQLQQLIAVYRRKHGGDTGVEAACEALRQLCLAAAANRNLFPIDGLYAALKVLHEADHTMSQPTLTGHRSGPDIVGQLPPGEAARPSPRDIEHPPLRDTPGMVEAIQDPTTVPPPPASGTPRNPRPLVPHPALAQPLTRLSTARSTPRTAPGSAERTDEKPPEPQ